MESKKLRKGTVRIIIGSVLLVFQLLSFAGNCMASGDFGDMFSVFEFRNLFEFGVLVAYLSPAIVGFILLGFGLSARARYFLIFPKNDENATLRYLAYQAAGIDIKTVITVMEEGCNTVETLRDFIGKQLLSYDQKLLLLALLCPKCKAVKDGEAQNVLWKTIEAMQIPIEDKNKIWEFVKADVAVTAE